MHFYCNMLTFASFTFRPQGINQATPCLGMPRCLGSIFWYFLQRSSPCKASERNLEASQEKEDHCWSQLLDTSHCEKNKTLQVRIAHAQPRSIWSEVDRPAKGPGAHPDLPGKSAAKPRYTQDRGPKGVSKGTLPRLCWEASAFGNLLAHPGA